MGESTFRSTATRMRTVGCLTHNMCKPDGTVSDFISSLVLFFRADTYFDFLSLSLY